MPNFLKPEVSREESEKLNADLRAFLASIGAEFPPDFWTAGWPQIRLEDITPRGCELEKAGQIDPARWKGRLIFHMPGLLSNDRNPFPHGPTRITLVRWGESPDECGLIECNSLPNAASIISYAQIRIGHNVLFGPRVVIMDCDGHSVDRTLPDRVENYRFAPVTIEDHVWLGLECNILKGVTVGHHAVVAARSVVTKDVPPHCVVAGNPARVVKDLRTDPEVIQRGEEQLAALKTLRANTSPTSLDRPS